MPTKNGKLINLKISTEWRRIASSIARGIIQYIVTIYTSKIPGIPFSFHFLNKLGNLFLTYSPINKPAIINNGICTSICVIIHFSNSPIVGGRSKMIYNKTPYINFFFIIKPSHFNSFKQTYLNYFLSYYLVSSG